MCSVKYLSASAGACFLGPVCAHCLFLCPGWNIGVCWCPCSSSNWKSHSSKSKSQGSEMTKRRQGTHTSPSHERCRGLAGVSFRFWVFYP